jgi:hypothetical protein
LERNKGHGKRPKNLFDDQLKRWEFVLSWGGGQHKERFKGNGNFLGGCKKGGFE